MAIPITFAEPATVNTGGQWTGDDAVYASGFGLYLLLGNQGVASVDQLQTTDDGTTFTMHAMPSSASYRSCDYAPTLGTIGRAVAVGNSVAAWSDDGVTWTAATSLPVLKDYVCVKWWPAQSLFVACSPGGITDQIMTSADGKSWTNHNAASVQQWSGIAVSETVAVCVASEASAGTQYVQTSADGSSWSLQTHPSISTSIGVVSSGLLRVGYSDTLDMFLIPGTAATITKAYRSTDDGVTWTASGVIPTVLNTTRRGFLWLGNGIDSWYMACRSLFYGESTDGDTWTVTALVAPITCNRFSPVNFDGTSIIFGGSDGCGDVAMWATIDVSSVISLSPDFGPSAGGTVVTIIGTGFSGTPTVTFGGTEAVSVIVQDDETIVCVTPPHVLGLFDVIVVGVGTLTNAFSFVEVTRVHPRAGTVAGGTAATITGYGFNMATAVLFGGTATAFTIVSNTSITTTTPAHTSGLVDVTVTGVGIGEGLYTYTLPVPQTLGKGPLLPPIPTRSRKA